MPTAGGHVGFSICMLGSCACFLVVCQLVSINSFRKTIRVSVGIQIRPDFLSGLIWVQTICKGYQQMTLVGKELKTIWLSQMTYLLLLQNLIGHAFI